MCWTCCDGDDDDGDDDDDDDGDDDDGNDDDDDDDGDDDDGDDDDGDDDDDGGKQVPWNRGFYGPAWYVLLVHGVWFWCYEICPIANMHNMPCITCDAYRAMQCIACHAMLWCLAGYDIDNPAVPVIWDQVRQQRSWMWCDNNDLEWDAGRV